MSSDHPDAAVATIDEVQTPHPRTPPGRGIHELADGSVGRAERRDRPAEKSAATVALIIPTKNEAGNISWVLEQVPPCVDEVVLVDGHSSDATVVTARCARPDLRVVHQDGIGKGDALRAGFLATEADIVVMIDADCSMSPQEIPHFLHFLATGYDFVKGSRFMAGGGSHDITRLRRWGNRTLVSVVNVMYEEQLTDLCYGFCAFHRRYLPFLDLTSAGFDVETKLTLSALAAGLRVAEVPSLEMPRRHGRSNLRTFPDGALVLRAILRGHPQGISGRVIQAGRALHRRTSRRERTPASIAEPQ